ncbi:Phosphoserine phosphatase [Sporothrix bragantina]|uniref:phosphoserine phosphatase n=1 Tax=Sporothrix bragantina TaxID=671064 RepID=A0ABP0C4L6_9PEZI
MSSHGRPPLASQNSFSLELPQGRRRAQDSQTARPATHYGIDEIVEGLDGLSSTPPPPVSNESLFAGPRGTVSSGKPGLPRRFSGVPDPRSPPVVVDSGIAHDLIHVNCTPVPGVSLAGDRLVATIFYKGHTSNQGAHGASPPATGGPAGSDAPGVTESKTTAGASSDSSSDELPANLAPTIQPSAFPLELPPADSEPPRDGLYGAYVSPICIAAFLHLMSTFPHRQTTAAPGKDTTTDQTLYSTGYGSNLTASHRYLDSATHPRVVELVLSPVPALPLADLRRHEQLYRFEREWGVEVALQLDTVWRRHPRLVVFDMDSTLITQEVIDMLAEAVTPDVAAKVAEITHRAMQGELQFDEAFRERVRLLGGLPETLFTDLRAQLNVTTGVPALLRGLRKLGVRTAVLSGGFQPLTGWLAGELGINHAHANNVIVGGDGRLTGEVTGAIVGRERKCELLKKIAADEGIELCQVVAVGDGANDLSMLEAAGLGVAWHAKPVVQLQADVRLNQPTMLDLLYLFGLTSAEVADLIERS